MIFCAAVICGLYDTFIRKQILIIGILNQIDVDENPFLTVPNYFNQF